MKTFGLAVLLFLLWILLSGHMAPLLLGLGAVSVALTVLLSRRMNVVDHESYPLHLSTRFPGYFLYLFAEIIKSNLDVVKRILGCKGTSINPQVVEIPQSQKSALGAVMYANSITLTPGTVTLRLSDDTLTVHALSDESAAELATGNMSEQITSRVFTQ